MRKDKEITTIAKQSSAITDAYLQYTQYTSSCWERTIAILRKEALDKGQPFGKRCPGGLNLKRICGIDFFQQIDEKHPERVVDALQFIFEHPVVLNKETYFGVSFISTFVENENKPGEYLLEFTNNVIRHYLVDDLSVEYDANLVILFRTSSAPILYKKACMFINSAIGFFDMTEDQIRLTFSIDTISDPVNLQRQKIKEISNLPIVKSGIYGRFDDLGKFLQRGLDEIENAYKEGKCPFFLSKEISKAKKTTGKRGKPQYEYSVRFYIISPEDNETAGDVEIEDAVIVEELPLKSEVSKLQAPAIEAEIPFGYDESVLNISLQKFREEITEIFRVPKASYAKSYIAQISSMVKERYASYPTLPSALLAWIEYTRKIVVADKKGPLDLLKMVQSKIERNCHVYYASDKNKSKKMRLYAKGDLTPIFPLGALSLGEEKEIISKDSTFFDLVGKELGLGENVVRKELESFYSEREENDERYYETLNDVVKAFTEWLYPNSSSTPTGVNEQRKENKASGSKSEQMPPKARQGKWEGEDAVVYDSVEAEVAALKINTNWRTVVLDRFKFMRRDENTLDEYIDKWALEVRGSGRKHSCLGDAKEHFTKRMIIEEEKSKNNKNNYGTDNNNGYRTREDILQGGVNIIRELRSEGSKPKRELPVV